jgi:hypothetical protein
MRPSALENGDPSGERFFVQKQNYLEALQSSNSERSDLQFEARKQVCVKRDM